MPRKFLDLPQDVLDSCLENLLPPLDSCVLLHHKYSIRIPEDLIRLQLVCKRLYSVALPWAWWRIAINDHLKGGGRINHPERFAHVRLFKLDVTRFTNDDLTVVLPRLKHCIAFMDKLQVLILKGKEFPGLELVDQVYVALTSRPRLHTLLVSSYGPHELPALTSLKRLIIYDVQLSLVVPGLESLAMFCERAVPGLSPLPWGTLRDVGLYNFNGLKNVLSNFSEWREAFPHMNSPLRDIYMDFAYCFPSDDIQVEEVQRIFEVLKGQNIRCLFLLGLPEVEWNLFNSISETFPWLQELTITHYLGNEDSTTLTIANALGRLPQLKYPCCQFQDAGPRSVRNTSWVKMLVHLIAQSCHVMEVVTLMSLSSDYVTYSTRRDHAYTPNNTGVLSSIDKYSRIYLSSSWCSAKYDCI